MGGLGRWGWLALGEIMAGPEVDFSVEQICADFGLTDVPLDYSGEAGAATSSLKVFQETYEPQIQAGNPGVPVSKLRMLVAAKWRQLSRGEGTFSLDTAPRARTSCLPVSLPAALLRGLEEGGRAKLELTGEGGMLRLVTREGGQETYRFSIVRSATSLPYVLREDGRKLETLHATERLQFCETTDSRTGGQVDGVKAELKKEQVKQKEIVGSEEKVKQELKVKQEQRMKQDKKGEKRKVGDTTTPESGYGTGNSSRMSEFEDDEKLEESDELSDQTPFKRRKSNQPAETLPRRSDSDITIVNITKNKDSVKKKLRLNLPPPACKSENKVVTISRTRLLLFPNVDTSFLKKYPPIKSKKDREAYKEEFEKTYSVYLEMEKKMLENFEEWKRLHALLALPPSPLRNPETIQKKLDQNVLASKKHKDVPKFEYFYEKLRHLKRVCAEWDMKQHQL